MKNKITEQPMMREQIDSEFEYGRAIDRSMTIEAILALDKRLTREYLNSLTLDALHDLKDSELDDQY